MAVRVRACGNGLDMSSGAAWPAMGGQPAGPPAVIRATTVACPSSE